MSDPDDDAVSDPDDDAVSDPDDDAVSDPDDDAVSDPDDDAVSDPDDDAVSDPDDDAVSDPDDDAAAYPSGRHERRRRDPRAAALIGVLTALLGFAIAVQLQSNSTGDALAGAREDDLVRILDDQNSRAARLRARITEQNELLARLDAAGGGAAARTEAQREADALAILTGTAAAVGPGVLVTITDPAHQLAAEDLLDVVEELRGAGAEAVQFGSVRVGTDSAFRDVDGHVVLDGVTLAAPYIVRAIGPPQTMDTAMNIPGGVAAVARTAGGDAQVVQFTRLEITVRRPLPHNRYATPAPR